MSKLLRANFSRLRKSGVYWFCMAAMIVSGVIVCLGQYRSKMQGFKVTMDSVFSMPYIISGILLAVLCSMFIGTEYSDGAIRNKLVVGRSRSSIYLANFTVSAVAGLLLNLIYMAVASALGIPLIGFFTGGYQNVLMTLLAGVLLTVAFTAVYTFLAMLIQSKALSAITCCIGILAALILGAYLYSALNEPEKIEAYRVQANSSIVVSIYGEDQQPEMVPNPNYLTGSRRAAVQFLMDFLPSGQMIQMVDMNTPNIKLLPVYSLVIIVAANAGGALLFRRKDLK